MSSVFQTKEVLSLAECPNTQLHYVKEQRQSGNQVVFSLKVKLEALSSWRRDLSGTLISWVQYIDLINLNIPGTAFLLDSKSERLESQLSKACIEDRNKIKFLNKKGTVKQRQEFLEKRKTLAVLEKDIVSVEYWKSQINTLEQKLEVAGAHIEKWKH